MNVSSLNSIKYQIFYSLLRWELFIIIHFYRLFYNNIIQRRASKLGPSVFSGLLGVPFSPEYKSQKMKKEPLGSTLTKNRSPKRILVCRRGCETTAPYGTALADVGKTCSHPAGHKMIEIPCS
jgi:hypothetical protein